MRPEYYADEYRRYQTYARNHGEGNLYRIACGASDFDYKWTEVMMERAAKYMDGLSLHYYTLAGDWKNKGSATDFSEDEWFITLKKALRMEELVQKHGEIMDRYDPEKRVGLIVDEWGTWYDVEPGTNPHFLFQQNSLRDALVAGVTLNIFNQHSDRVYMANLAQTVNVLQALILTEGDKFLLTPTYHVFDLYKAHQGAALLETIIEQAATYGNGNDRLPQVSLSASEDDQGRINITLCNLDNRATAKVGLALKGLVKGGKVSGSTLAAKDMHAHNTFSNPDTLRPVALAGLAISDGELNVELAPMSVTLLTIE